MRFTPNLIALCVASLLFGSTAHAEEDTLLITVNGTDVHQSDYDRFVANVSPKLGKLTHEQVIEELTTRELMRQNAVSSGLDKTPEMVATQAAYQHKLLISAAIRSAVAANPVSEEELVELYNKHKASLTQSELKASHILVRQKDEALDLIAQLDDGADFATLAKEHSVGPSGKDGGSLGWFDINQMVPEFSAAAMKMEKGAHSVVPTNTQFGWHVILLEDRRENTPSLDDVRDKLLPLAQQSRVESYLNSLRESATIELK